MYWIIFKRLNATNKFPIIAIGTAEKPTIPAVVEPMLEASYYSLGEGM